MSWASGGCDNILHVKKTVETGKVQTETETKLLYCSMFLFKMSEQGPRTRSNLGRSSLTHLRGPHAITVAARGRFISRAISPGSHRKDKQSSRAYKAAGGVLLRYYI